MLKNRSGYLLGLGSNLNPADNYIGMVEQLLTIFHRVDLSRVLWLPPFGIDSQHLFLNGVAFIETDLPQDELKRRCRSIEAKLGRDRSYVAGKPRDKTADVDILKAISIPEDLTQANTEITDERFFYPLLDELKMFLQQKTLKKPLDKGVRLSIKKSTFGETATTIDWNGSASHKRIIHQAFNR